MRIGAAATTLAPTSGPVVVAAGSSMFAFREGFVSSDGIPTIENESLNGRMQSRYAGITTTLSAACLLYTSPSPRDGLLSRMPSSA